MNNPDMNKAKKKKKKTAIGSTRDYSGKRKLQKALIIAISSDIIITQSKRLD